MSDPRANIEITASSSKLATGLRSAAQRVHGFAGDVRASIKGAFSSSIGSSVGNIVGGIASRGIDVIGDSARGVMDFERNLTRLGIAGGLNAAQLDGLRKTARDVSSSIGIGADQILAGAQTYVDLTGDIKGASGSMELFARIAQASGASVSDVAQATAAFKGAGIPIEAMEKTFSGLITQGKAGAVSLKDFAGELAGLAPRWAKFNEGTSESGIAQLGAAFQTARQGFGSASEAATGLQALMGALSQNARKFAAAGVRIYDVHRDGSKTMRTFEQIMSDMERSKLVKDPTLMTKAMGSKEAEQTATMLLRARHTVEGQVSAYGQLVEAGLDANAVQRDLATYQQSSSGRMEASWERVKNKIAEALTPERIEKFASAMEGLSNLIGKIVDGIEALSDFIDKQEKAQDVKKSAQEITDKYAGMSPLEKQVMADKLAKQGAAKEALVAPVTDSWFSSLARLGGAPEMEGALAPFRGKAELQAASQLKVQSITDKNKPDPWAATSMGAPMPETTPAAAQAALEKSVRDGMRDGFNSIRDSLGLTVKVENETVAKANTKAVSPRRG